jgi:hypothetical protein
MNMIPKPAVAIHVTTVRITTVLTMIITVIMAMTATIMSTNLL